MPLPHLHVTGQLPPALPRGAPHTAPSGEQQQLDETPNKDSLLVRWSGDTLKAYSLCSLHLLSLGFTLSSPTYGLSIELTASPLHHQALFNIMSNSESLLVLTALL